MRPTRRRAARALAIGALVVATAACGKKGDPLPPLRPVPARILDLAAVLDGDRVTLSFTVPATNTDNTSPPAISRLDVYRLLVPADTPPPTAGRVIDEGDLLTSLEVAVGTVDAAPPPDALAPGAPARVDDVVPPGLDTHPETAPSLWYLVVGIAGRDRAGPPSGRVEVPVGAVVPPPTALRASHDATTLTLEWAPADDTGHFVVEELVDAGAEGGERAIATPVDAPRSSWPVEFGRTRCFVVRAAVVTATTTVLSPPSARLCETPVDTFPPNPPSGLAAIQESVDPVVTLRWRASPSPDTAGYLVLRADGAGETLRPLAANPVSGTSFRDVTVEVGRTYVYAVVAANRASPPNLSGQSNRETIVVR